MSATAMDSAIATRQDSHTPRQPCVIKVGASQGRASQWPCHGNRAPRKNHARGNHAHSELDADTTQLSIKLDRKTVGLGKSVSDRVDLGGRRIFNKKKKPNTT